jgi:hypothetical protein
MKYKPMFIVEVAAKRLADPDNEGGVYMHRGCGFFDRMPTLEELVRSYLDQIDGNERILPGFTEAILEVAFRGIPTPPDDFPPNVAASFDYGDGFIRVTRSLHTTLDES